MLVTARQPLSLKEVQAVRVWRNDPDVLPMLRTGFKTSAEQAMFYQDVICNPHADHWYFAMLGDGRFLGMGGLTYLSRAPGEGEISLIVAPGMRGVGFGSACVDVLLQEAWTRGLYAVIGECYPHGAIGFWQRQFRQANCRTDIWWTGSSLHWRWTVQRKDQHGSDALPAA